MSKRSVMVWVVIIFGVFFCTQTAKGGLVFKGMIPNGTIMIDGEAGDWVGIKPLLEDAEFDTLCGEGTDFESLYLCRDDQYLYWRLDTYSGFFALGTVDSWKGPLIHFRDDRPSFNTAVKWQKTSVDSEGRLLKRIYNVDEDRFEYALVGEGTEWGVIGDIAEGKIPLSVFEQYEIIGVSGWYGSKDINPCDSVSSRFAVPDIQANGSDGPVTVADGTPVSVTVELTPVEYAGFNADWWIAVHTPFSAPGDWYTYVYPTGWMPGVHRCVQTPLFEFVGFEVLNMALPAGPYTFYFAVDPPDGVPTAELLDSVAVEVTP